MMKPDVKGSNAIEAARGLLKMNESNAHITPHPVSKIAILNSAGSWGSRKTMSMLNTVYNVQCRDCFKVDR